MINIITSFLRTLFVLRFLLSPFFSVCFVVNDFVIFAACAVAVAVVVVAISSFNQMMQDRFDGQWRRWLDLVQAGNPVKTEKKEKVV